MKATGIVRRIDELGRVVIPKEIRRTLRIREGDPSLIPRRSGSTKNDTRTEISKQLRADSALTEYLLRADTADGADAPAPDFSPEERFILSLCSLKARGVLPN